MLAVPPIRAATDPHPIAGCPLIVYMVNVKTRMSLVGIQALNAWHQLIIALIVLPHSLVRGVVHVSLSTSIIVGALGSVLEHARACKGGVLVCSRPSVFKNKQI